jgi:hypothetical protein
MRHVVRWACGALAVVVVAAATSLGGCAKVDINVDGPEEVSLRSGRTAGQGVAEAP